MGATARHVPMREIDEVETPPLRTRVCSVWSQVIMQVGRSFFPLPFKIYFNGVGVRYRVCDEDSQGRVKARVKARVKDLHIVAVFDGGKDSRDFQTNRSRLTLHQM